MAPPMVVAAGVSAAGSLLAGQAAMAAGRYQQTIAERNAGIYENKAENAILIGERNIDTFNKQFDKQISSTEAAYIKSGVKMSGTPLAVLEENLAEAEIERLNIMYDARTQSYDFKQQAVNARMQGELAMYQARQQRAASFISAAGTLVGAYATQNLIKTQTQNQQILNDTIIKNQEDLIYKQNNLQKQLITIQNKNSILLNKEFGQIR